MAFTVIKNSLAYPEILNTLQNLLKAAKCTSENCDKPLDHYSFSELNLSADNLAFFIDAINEEYSLILSKKDFSTIRSIKSLAKTIEMIRC
jgi:hypothetical protein